MTAGLVEAYGHAPGCTIGHVSFLGTYRQPYASFLSKSEIPPRHFGGHLIVLLLGLAIGNQWQTLTAIAQEIDGQRNRLRDDHPAVRDDFIEVFDDLDGRIRWHRKALVIVTVAAAAGAFLATIAFLMLTEAGSAACLLPR